MRAAVERSVRRRSTAYPIPNYIRTAKTFNEWLRDRTGIRRGAAIPRQLMHHSRLVSIDQGRVGRRGCRPRNPCNELHLAMCLRVRA